jgi:hypothetical protein
MPDLNHSNKGECGFWLGGHVHEDAGKGVVTFGARNEQESLPSAWDLANNRSLKP